MPTHTSAVPSNTPEHLRRMIEILWPDGVDAPGARLLEFVLIPSSQRPKLVIPRRPLTATAAAVRNYKAFATGFARHQMRFVALLARLGVLRLTPHRLSVQRGPHGIDSYLGEALGAEVLVAMYVGPPRAVQKPVVQVITAAGETIAFAKIGINRLTEELVRTEARTLKLLREHELTSLRVPDVLHTGQFNGHEILVQSAILPTRAEGPSRELLIAATGEATTVGGKQRLRWASSEFRETLHRRFERLSGDAHHRLLRRALDLCDQSLGDGDLWFGSSHGDWAPWNMTRVRGELVAWDWEYFRQGVPTSLDAVHYDVSERVALRGQSPQEAFEQVRTATSGTLTSDLHDSSERTSAVLVYIADLLIRYVEDDEVGAAGTAMSRIEEWAEAVLDRCAERISSTP
jgi:hypothetical protein